VKKSKNTKKRHIYEETNSKENKTETMLGQLGRNLNSTGGGPSLRSLLDCRCSPLFSRSIVLPRLAAVNPTPFPSSPRALSPSFVATTSDIRYSLPSYARCPRSSSVPSPATNATRYAHPLSSLPCCAKPCTQTLYSDLI
jgi:hypothetical protein